MKIISNKNKLIKIIQSEKNLGFVPTMGAIHKGHLSLIKKSIKQCKKTVVSIFVNKPQFNKKSDYMKYPRFLNKDISILKKSRVNYLFVPSAKQIYPSNQNKKIKIHPFGKRLCGRFRKGHFEAVVDVVDRFVKIIKPNKIYFGEKDMQQLKIVKDYILKNHTKTKVISCKTIREKTGVAYSSRNYLLSKSEKKTASKIYKLLLKKKKKLIKNKFHIKNIKKEILKIGASKIDYIEILNVSKLIRPFLKKSNYRIFTAYYLGSTRLIDNI